MNTNGTFTGDRIRELILHGLVTSVGELHSQTRRDLRSNPFMRCQNTIEYVDSDAYCRPSLKPCDLVSPSRSNRRTS